jgi:hypothetical protein
MATSKFLAIGLLKPVWKGYGRASFTEASTFSDIVLAYGLSDRRSCAAQPPQWLHGPWQRRPPRDARATASGLAVMASFPAIGPRAPGPLAAARVLVRMAAALGPARMAAAAPRDPRLEVLGQRPRPLGLGALQVGYLAENPAGQFEAREAQAQQGNRRRVQFQKKGWQKTLRYREGQAPTR